MRLKAQNAGDAAELARALSCIGQTRSGDDRKDAEAFAEAIEKLVKDLGLESRLSEYGVKSDQGDVMAKRATEREEGGGI